MTRLLLLVLFLALAGPPSAAAQVGQVPINGTVHLPGVSGAGVRMLDFGTLDPVNPTQLLATDTTNPRVGHLRFTGLTGPQGITVDIQLPSVLTHLSIPGATIPLTFDNTSAYACMERKVNPAHCFASWNPAIGGTVTLTPPSPSGQNTGTLNLYVGGQLPSATEYAAGTYRATITVTVSRV